MRQLGEHSLACVIFMYMSNRIFLSLASGRYSYLSSSVRKLTMRNLFTYSRTPVFTLLKGLSKMV
jgi:hypothetical protein